MTRKDQHNQDTPKDNDKQGKGVRWSSEVADHQKEKAPPASKPAPASSASNDDAASEQLARALSALPSASLNPKQYETQEATIKLENDWELTWPIWHMLPWMERKEIAQRHGYQTIGAFEEYMSLQKALDDEQGATTKPYSNSLAYPKKEFESKPAAVVGEDEEGDEDDEDTDSEEDDKLATRAETKEEGEVDSDSLLLTFPDEILHKIFSFLPVTLYGTKLPYVSLHPHWRRVTQSEAVMKQLCERVYLQQSKKKQLRVSKFHHSYRFMLYSRPRVQAGGGVYVLRFGRVKKIQRDMWTNVPHGAILETVYYRYLYFEEHGHCLYALSTIPPHDMLKRFHRVLLQSSRENPEAAMFEDAQGFKKKKAPRKLSAKEKELRAAQLDTRVVWGTYAIQKDKVTVTAQQSWNTVQFGLRIVTHHNRPYEEHKYLHPNKDDAKPPPASKPAAAGKLKEDDGEEHSYVNGSDEITVSPHGRFGILQLETHRSSISGNFDEHDTYLEQVGAQLPQVYYHSDVVNYQVEGGQEFRFLPNPRF